MRDEFPRKDVETLAKRVGNRCSNPEHRSKSLSGPHTDPTKAVNIGVAAHIAAASEGGPRYDPAMTSKERQSIANAIWLCGNCHTIVDRDEVKYTVTVLRQWREDAEAYASAVLTRGELRPETGDDGLERAHKPFNLPLVSIGTLFKGREAFLDDLRDRFGLTDKPATSIVKRVAVHGLGGVGKTRAAVEYALRYADKYSSLLLVSGRSPAELRANLANLIDEMKIRADGMPVDEQLAVVLDWLNAHPGWLLIVDNVDTEEAAQETTGLLPRLRVGHVLITSRIANWSAGIDTVELDVLARADATEFLLARTPHRPKATDDAVQVAAVAGELDGLALALEQAGAHIDKQRLSFAEYLHRWNAKRSEVLGWHDSRLMQYPASVAVTWETTFAQLTDPERLLLEVLAWLAPEPIPLLLFDCEPLWEAIANAREAIAGLAGYSLVRFDASGNTVLVHRLVQEITAQNSEGRAHRDAANRPGGGG